ncbi:AlbA family DNA-binding domain-containing protein [Streptomyces massasporeus]|uniref:AlbA family DNA-binding domain-containing protein n=1 Tax=Streptomyces massasporeus TaxID=67324 RepID=UPI00381C7610
MTLDFNADEPVVGLARQRELIRAVLNASSADETRWLEWKSQHDVLKAAGAFAVSKAILGFANRMPDVAEQWAGGHAYLLVGVDEDAIHGVPTHDVEKVDSWLRRYLGEYSRYQFTYVPMDTDEGKRHVMLVDVPAHVLPRPAGGPRARWPNLRAADAGTRPLRGSARSGSRRPKRRKRSCRRMSASR